MDSKIIKKYHAVKQWLYAHPKKVFTYSLVILGLSFVFSIIQYFAFPPHISTGKIPMLYSNADKPSDTGKNKELEMKQIVDEMKVLKNKKDNGQLTHNDSLRIHYLYNRYQTLKNGH